MALDPIDKPQYPDVPDADGVPNVARPPGSSAGDDQGTALSGVTVTAQKTQPQDIGDQWGIADKSGTLVISGDAVSSFEYSKDYDVAKYPTEDGSFQSYNKVEQPFDVRISFVKSGTAEDRQQFLTDVAKYVGDFTEFYSVLTPEVTYASVTLDHFDYKRTSTNGTGMLTVNIYAMQVRVTATADFSNTTDPSDEDDQDDGSVQADDDGDDVDDLVTDQDEDIDDVDPDDPAAEVAGTAASFSIPPVLTNAFSAAGNAALHSIRLTSLLGASPSTIFTSALTTSKTAAMTVLQNAAAGF
jgi:hypothetical protein